MYTTQYVMHSILLNLPPRGRLCFHFSVFFFFYFLHSSALSRERVYDMIITVSLARVRTYTHSPEHWIIETKYANACTRCTSTFVFVCCVWIICVGIRRSSKLWSGYKYRYLCVCECIIVDNITNLSSRIPSYVFLLIFFSISYNGPKE